MRNRLHPHLPSLLLLAASAALSACGESHAAATGEPQGTPDVTLPLVPTVRVVLEDLTASVTMPGSVEALEAADLYAKVGGYLARMNVDIGDEVQAGQVLAVLDNPEALAELRRAEAEIALARSQVDQQAAAAAQAQVAVATAEADLAEVRAARGERAANLALREVELARWEQLLAESPSIEKRKLDEARGQRAAAEAGLALAEAQGASAQARVAEARAAVRKAEADQKAAEARVPVAEANRDAARELLDYAEIRSPFAGVITERHVDPGAFIRPAATNSGAMPLLRVERVDRVRVVVNLPMDVTALVNRGDRIRFDDVMTAPGAVFEGTVTRVSGALDERSRMLRAEVELDNPAAADGGRRLRPGGYGSLTVALEEHPATPTVPASAVLTRDGEAFVFRVVDGTAHRTPIQVVFQDGSKVGASAGLSVGQELVASGVDRIKDGQAVRTKPADGGGR